MAGTSIINLDLLPALQPPPGVKSNFVNPYSEAKSLYITAGVCGILVTLAVIVRIYTKACIIKTVNFEDYMLLSSYISFLTGIVFFVMEGQFGAGTHQWDVPTSHFFHLLGLVNASETIYCVQIVFAKLAVLLQMKRLLTGSKKDLVYWAFIVLIVANTGFYISGFFMEIFACAPRAKIWNPLLPGSCQDPAVSVLVAGVFNCVSDVLMLVLPLYAIWRLNIKLKTRLGVGAVFATGVIACILSALRIYFSQTLLGEPDVTFFSVPSSCVSLAESASIMLIATFPTFPRFLKFVRGKEVSTWGASRTQKSGHSRSASSLAASSPLKPVRAIIRESISKPFASSKSTFERPLDPRTADAWLDLNSSTRQDSRSDDSDVERIDLPTIPTYQGSRADLSPVSSGDNSFLFQNNRPQSPVSPSSSQRLGSPSPD